MAKNDMEKMWKLYEIRVKYSANKLDYFIILE